jgi:hypothetical protein
LMTPMSAVCRNSPLPLCHSSPTLSAISRPKKKRFADDADAEPDAEHAAERDVRGTGFSYRQPRGLANL